MRVNLLVGGPVELIPQEVVRSRRAETWIAVDHGASLLLKWGILPAAAVGDFDSTSPAEFAQVQRRLAEIETFPPAKDFTDTQLGVKLAIDRYQPAQIDVFGATGGRLDHFLANLYLPLQDCFQNYLDRIRLLDRGNTVSYYRPGAYTITKEADKDYLAFVNLTPVTGLTLPDEKYPLNDWSSTIPFSWSSNRFTAAENHFSFTSGVVAVIQAADGPQG
ncbi:thiamine diphosphokinase [Limosilactobacillus antri]|uniref:thiamine diphosphokinase n=1 Tax=Limosilactobacillus antri TaxID=227943 RepID=UPI001F55E118|nr:thiamine diphosphokinase [Limosilactobacillus antri]